MASITVVFRKCWTDKEVACQRPRAKSRPQVASSSSPKHFHSNRRRSFAAKQKVRQADGRTDGRTLGAIDALAHPPTQISLELLICSLATWQHTCCPHSTTGDNRKQQQQSDKLLPLAPIRIRSLAPVQLCRNESSKGPRAVEVLGVVATLGELASVAVRSAPSFYSGRSRAPLPLAPPTHWLACATLDQRTLRNAFSLLSHALEWGKTRITGARARISAFVSTTLQSRHGPTPTFQPPPSFVVWHHQPPPPPPSRRRRRLVAAAALTTLSHAPLATGKPASERTNERKDNRILAAKHARAR